MKASVKIAGTNRLIGLVVDGGGIKGEGLV